MGYIKEYKEDESYYYPSSVTITLDDFIKELEDNYTGNKNISKLIELLKSPNQYNNTNLYDIIMRLFNTNYKIMMHFKTRYRESKKRIATRLSDEYKERQEAVRKPIDHSDTHDDIYRQTRSYEEDDPLDEVLHIEKQNYLVGRVGESNGIAPAIVNKFLSLESLFEVIEKLYSINNNEKLKSYISRTDEAIHAYCDQLKEAMERKPESVDLVVKQLEQYFGLVVSNSDRIKSLIEIVHDELHFYQAMALTREANLKHRKVRSIINHNARKIINMDKDLQIIEFVLKEDPSYYFKPSSLIYVDSTHTKLPSDYAERYISGKGLTRMYSPSSLQEITRGLYVVNFEEDVYKPKQYY